MKYDFTTIMDRHGLDAIAVDMIGAEGGFAPAAPKDGFDVIPMWVADMNFPTCPTITETVKKRLDHPAFGYFEPRQEYTDAIIDWHKTRHGITELQAEHIGYENGVLGGVISALNVFCSRGDKVLLHSPTYIGFTNSLINNGYNIVHSPLRLDDEGIWRMDYEDMEAKIKGEHIHATIFCSPHNPCGRVWEKWEIEKAMEIFARYDVKVISDEIWSDIILAGHKHIPTQSVSEDARHRTVALYAPSKTFNLAGFVGSYHIIYDDVIRDRVVKESSLSHYNMMNVLSMYALMGGYSRQGMEWTDELCEVLTKNVDFACEYIHDNLLGLSCSKPQGTYMLFVNCEEYCKKHDILFEELLHKMWDVGVAVQDGRMFHGPCHVRINLASPFSKIKEAFERLAKYVIV